VKRTVENIDFSWANDAKVPEGAVFSVLPGRVEVVAVNHDYVGCQVCVVDNGGVTNICGQMPNCDSLTFMPNTQETVIQVVKARITGRRYTG
jgi:hypothetical protein